MKKKISMISLLVLMVLSLFALPALAASPVTPPSNPTVLSATGTQGTHNQVTIDLTGKGVTLGSLQSISWSEYLVNGYTPYLNVFFVTAGSAITDSLCFEYAYNSASHYAEGQHTGDTAYGALTGAWYSTFSDDDGGPVAVTQSSFAWLNSGGAGPYPVSASLPIDYSAVGGNFIGGALAQWGAGDVVTGVDASAVVTKIEIRVDNWIVDTTALVGDISIEAGGSSVGLSATVVANEQSPDIVAITVSPTAIDFGPVVAGGSYNQDVVVTNSGTSSADVTTSTDAVPGTLFGDGNLVIDPTTFTLATTGATQSVGLSLNVPVTYASTGAENASLIFEATPTP